MNFEEFEKLARLHVVGALDDEESARFELLRAEGGAKAEKFLQECERLNTAFALSLRPSAPSLSTRQRLLDLVRNAKR